MPSTSDIGLAALVADSDAGGAVAAMGVLALGAVALGVVRVWRGLDPETGRWTGMTTEADPESDPEQIVGYVHPALGPQDPDCYLSEYPEHDVFEVNAETLKSLGESDLRHLHYILLLERDSRRMWRGDPGPRGRAMEADCGAAVRAVEHEGRERTARRMAWWDNQGRAEAEASLSAIRQRRRITHPSHCWSFAPSRAPPEPVLYESPMSSCCWFHGEDTEPGGALFDRERWHSWSTFGGGGGGMARDTMTGELVSAEGAGTQEVERRKAEVRETWNALATTQGEIAPDELATMWMKSKAADLWASKHPRERK
jgi:hypothetical protein